MHLAIFLIIFYLKVVETPTKLDMEPTYLQDKTPRKYFFKQRNFRVWCVIAMLSSICRYGLLTWIPMYYKVETGKEMLNPIFTNLMFPLGMAIGTLLITWCAGSRYSQNLGLVIISASALCGTLIFIFPMLTESKTILVGIFFSGFFLYGINGTLWLYAMEQGGKHFSGTTAGIINCFAYIGAGLEMLIFPLMLKMSGEILSVFLLMELICVGMVICGMVVSKKDTIVEPEIRE